MELPERDLSKRAFEFAWRVVKLCMTLDQMTYIGQPVAQSGDICWCKCRKGIVEPELTWFRNITDNPGGRVRRFFFWDDLDFVYFGGYATWNYLTIPFLFLREGYVIEILRADDTGPPSPGPVLR